MQVSITTNKRLLTILTHQLLSLVIGILPKKQLIMSVKIFQEMTS